MAVEGTGPTPKCTKGVLREGKQARRQWRERANRAWDISHKPGHHDTVCTGRALRHCQLKHLAQLVIFTLSDRAQVWCFFGQVTSSVPHQKGWGNPDGVPMKPSKGLGLRLQGMTEAGTALRAAETTTLWAVIREMTYKAWCCSWETK